MSKKIELLFQMTYVYREFAAGRLKKDELLIVTDEYIKTFKNPDFLKKEIISLKKSLKKDLHRMHIFETQKQLLETDEFYKKKLKPKPV